MSENSKEIRSQIEKRRRALTIEQVLELSEKVCERFLSQVEREFGAEFFRGRRVGLYRALPRELSLLSIESRLVQAGAILHFPKITDRAQTRMEMLQVDSHHLSGFETGPYGVHEPPLQAVAAVPSSLDMMIIPGVAFGPKGERVGMGAGYYDRYLIEAPQALRTSLVFDFQLLPELAQSEWDQPMHWILTEKNEVRTEALEAWKKSFLQKERAP